MFVDIAFETLRFVEYGELWVVEHLKEDIFRYAFGSVSAYCFDKLQNGFARFMTGMI